MRISPETARRSSYFDIDSKLQELVEAEFDVILKAPPQNARPQKPAAVDEALSQYTDEEERPLPESLALPFSPEEESFIASSIAFLRGRANADLLLEELWSAAISPAAPETDAGKAEEAAKSPAPETPDGGKPGGRDDV